jgi:uroporphyrin-III C-methyltransferase / precorrin-2 dehydrogenase / sirohydrochlorin ferrochelatase
MTMDPSLLPVFLKLAGRNVLVVGGGPVAASKMEPLLAAEALITVVSPQVVPEIATAEVTVHLRGFLESDLAGVWYVVAAATPEINRVVAAAAERRQIFVNAVDDPSNASAYAGAVLRPAGVTIAISTDGRAPAVAGLLREALEALLPDDVSWWVETAQAARAHWVAQGTPLAARRPLLLETLNSLYQQRGRGLTAPEGRHVLLPPSHDASASAEARGDSADGPSPVSTLERP